MTTPRIEEMVDSVMGLIIENSVGLIYSDKPNDYGYANGVYLNNIKAELPSILTQAHQAGREAERERIETHFSVMSDPCLGIKAVEHLQALNNPK